LPRIGHDMRAHASLEVSHREPASGAKSDALADAFSSWFTALSP